MDFVLTTKCIKNSAFSGIMFHFQVMLFRRTTKLVELDAANKALAKAKPKNQDQVLEHLLFALVTSTLSGVKGSILRVCFCEINKDKVILKKFSF